MNRTQGSPLALIRGTLEISPRDPYINQRDKECQSPRPPAGNGGERLVRWSQTVKVLSYNSMGEKGHLWLEFRPNPFSTFGDQVSPQAKKPRACQSTLRASRRVFSEPAQFPCWQSCSLLSRMSTMKWASVDNFAASYPSSPTSTMHPTFFAQPYASFAAPPQPAPTGTTNWQQGQQQADLRPPPLVRQNAFWR